EQQAVLAIVREHAPRRHFAGFKRNALADADERRSDPARSFVHRKVQLGQELPHLCLPPSSGFGTHGTPESCPSTDESRNTLPTGPLGPVTARPAESQRKVGRPEGQLRRRSAPGASAASL